MTKRSQQSYQEIRVTLADLWKSGPTGQRSLDALRARAKQHFLVYLGSDGPTQIFDRDLSIVRLAAATKCKGPGITWGRLGAAVRALDRGNINDEIRNDLSNGRSVKDVAASLVEQFRRELG